MGMHNTNAEIVFDLTQKKPRYCFFIFFSPCETVQASGLFSESVLLFVSISFELKLMRCVRAGRQLFGSVAVITDLWSLSNLIMTV